MQRRKYHYYQPSPFTQLLILHNYITSDGVLETEDARTEYGLPKIGVKLAHAYTADTRLPSSSPPRELGEPRNEANRQVAPCEI